MCVGTNVCGHNRVSTSMYGHKRVVSLSTAGSFFQKLVGRFATHLSPLKAMRVEVYSVW